MGIEVKNCFSALHKIFEVPCYVLVKIQAVKGMLKKTLKAFFGGLLQFEEASFPQSEGEQLFGGTGEDVA